MMVCTPETACSIRFQLVLVIDPQVPESSPLPSNWIFSDVEYEDAMFYPIDYRLFQSKLWTRFD